jgi:hypothetical protein
LIPSRMMIRRALASSREIAGSEEGNEFRDIECWAEGRFKA